MRTSAEQRSAHSIDATLCKLLQVRAKYQGLTMWKKAGCIMQDFAMKIITSGTTLAELGRDCHTQAMVCAALAAHAVALPPPSTPRRMSRPLALALACAIAVSTSHLQLALASPASATSSLSRLVYIHTARRDPAHSQFSA